MSSTKRMACPICGPKNKPLAVTTDERGTVSYCHRCHYTESNNVASVMPFVHQARSYPKFRDKAEAIWSRAKPLAGTLAEKYLTRRLCRLPPEDGDLRFLPARGSNPAAMLGRVTDALTGEPISLHFTLLNADGTKTGDKPKRLLAKHRKAGGVIRLWPDDCVTYGLAIAEGIETAVCAAHGFTPIWAMIDAGNMKSFPVLKGIDALTIFADNDAAGIDAAEQCERRWAQVAEVAVVMSEQARFDICDEVAA